MNNLSRLREYTTNNEFKITFENENCICFKKEITLNKKDVTIELLKRSDLDIIIVGITTGGSTETIELQKTLDSFFIEEGIPSDIKEVLFEIAL